MERIAIHIASISSALFPMEDWRYEVENGDTTLGFEGWVDSKCDLEAEIALDAVIRLLHGASRLETGELGPEEMANRFENILSDLRMSDDEAADRARVMAGTDAPDGLLFGETCRILPPDMAEDISRLAFRTLRAFEPGGATPAQIDALILEIADRHGIEAETVDLVRARSAEGSPSP